MTLDVQFSGVAVDSGDGKPHAVLKAQLADATVCQGVEAVMYRSRHR
jgi:hypothetical protein